MMIIMLKIKMKRELWTIRGFTLLETLIVLSVTVLITLMFSINLESTLHRVKGELFILRFEHFYKITQEDAALFAEKESISVKNKRLYWEKEYIDLPQEVDCGTFLITFDEKGENSSLQKVSFYLPEEKKTIIYQLELGSGKFKKEVS